MAESSFPSYGSVSSANSTNSSSENNSQARTLEPVVVVRRFVFSLAIATLFLMALGSATRVMNAGLSCPDWPLCYGEVIPAAQMDLQVFLEWFHRLVASTIGFLTITLVGLTLWWRRSLPKWLPWAAGWAFLLVVFQGILGGLTVTQLLRFDIVTAHLGTGLLFFCTLLSIGMSLLPYQPCQTSGKLTWIGGTAAGLVYGQSILGGLVASRWAAHQCLAGADLCAVLNSHFVGVVPASLATLTVVVLAWRTPALNSILRRLAFGAGALLWIQVLLGVATYALRLQVEPLTVMHQAIGAALLGTLVSFTVLAIRDRNFMSSPVAPIASVAAD
ncbi:cytochrome oxidase assembly [Thalassoporum mexicanum PCC 7367]|uniref:COX15/CtaA family protein n=1 Tax=Thalassoporum mexicanum TaxID=3457544 RepID=UPI00029F8455|nr:heme A synthase [Pseudanabaena sp. PCC 7367]AFY68487.1 cytochrome oxidase assembly [Pseudanabaena sp. PCC 7367]